MYFPDLYLFLLKLFNVSQDMHVYFKICRNPHYMLQPGKNLVFSAISTNELELFCMILKGSGFQKSVFNFLVKLLHHNPVLSNGASHFLDSPLPT